MTLIDLGRRDAKGRTFPEDFCNYAPTLRPRTTKLAVETLVGKGVFLGFRHPNLQGRAQRWDPLVPTDRRSYGLTYSHQIWHSSTRKDGLWVTPAPYPKVQGTSVPNLSWNLYMRAHSVRNSNKILHDDQTIIIIISVYFSS